MIVHNINIRRTVHIRRYTIHIAQYTYTSHTTRYKHTTHHTLHSMRYPYTLHTTSSTLHALRTLHTRRYTSSPRRTLHVVSHTLYITWHMTHYLPHPTQHTPHTPHCTPHVAQYAPRNVFSFATEIIVSGSFLVYTEIVVWLVYRRNVHAHTHHTLTHHAWYITHYTLAATPNTCKGGFFQSLLSTRSHTERRPDCNLSSRLYLLCDFLLISKWYEFWSMWMTRDVV